MGSYTVRAMVFLSRIFNGDRCRAVLVAALLSLAAISAPTAGAPVTIVVLGDSLVAGFGLAPGESFPEQLQARLRETDAAVEFINAGVSGDTTAGGLSRLEWSIPENADGVIVALGANDALRGIEPMETRRNLERILERLRVRGQPVLLAGMLAPPNLGEEYGEAFAKIYGDLAAMHGVPLYPFFLEGVAAEWHLNLSDGMHPNREGVAIMVERMAPMVREFVADLRAGEGAE